MTGVRTVFAVVPAAAAAESAVAAFQALPLADNARLVGLHVAPLAITYGLATDMALASFIEAQMAAADEERKAAEAAFLGAAKKAGIAFEWRAEKSPDNLVSPHAGAMSRAADMILCPQLPNEASIGRHQLEEVVFTSGRPVIGLPVGWSVRKLGNRVLIAWDGGREAARAVFDALPLLVGAEAVRIVSVQGFLDDPVRQFTPGDDIAATLARHGVPRRDDDGSRHPRQRQGRAEGAGARFRRRPYGHGMLWAFAHPRAHSWRRFAQHAEGNSVSAAARQLTGQLTGKHDARRLSRAAAPLRAVRRVSRIKARAARRTAVCRGMLCRPKWSRSGWRPGGRALRGGSRGRGSTRYGPNALPAPPRRTILGIFVGQLASPLVYLLLAAAAVSIALGEFSDALASSAPCSS